MMMPWPPSVNDSKNLRSRGTSTITVGCLLEDEQSYQAPMLILSESSQSSPVAALQAICCPTAVVTSPYGGKTVNGESSSP